MHSLLLLILACFTGLLASAAQTHVQTEQQTITHVQSSQSKGRSLPRLALQNITQNNSHFDTTSTEDVSESNSTRSFTTPTTSSGENSERTATASPDLTPKLQATCTEAEVAAKVALALTLSTSATKDTATEKKQAPAKNTETIFAVSTHMSFGTEFDRSVMGMPSNLQPGMIGYNTSFYRDLLHSNFGPCCMRTSNSSPDGFSYPRPARKD